MDKGIYGNPKFEEFLIEQAKHEPPTEEADVDHSDRATQELKMPVREFDPIGWWNIFDTIQEPELRKKLDRLERSGVTSFRVGDREYTTEVLRVLMDSTPELAKIDSLAELKATLQNAGIVDERVYRDSQRTFRECIIGCVANYREIPYVDDPETGPLIPPPGAKI